MARNWWNKLVNRNGRTKSRQRLHPRRRRSLAVELLEDRYLFAAGVFQFSAATYAVNESAGSVNIDIVRSGGSDGAATVDLALTDGTAKAGTDYTNVSLTVPFADQETDKQIAVPVKNDFAVDGDKTFTMTLSNAATAGLGTPTSAVVTIHSDVAGAFEFDAATSHVGEDDGLLRLTVSRVGNAGSLGGPVSVGLRASGGTATAGVDYEGLPSSILFGTTDSTENVYLTIKNDNQAAGNKTLVLSLIDPSNGGTLGEPGTTTVTIFDEERPSPASPVTVLNQHTRSSLPESHAYAPARAVVKGALYFTADDGRHGNELWKETPGQPPQMVGDIAEGPLGSNPRLLTPLGNALFFVTDALQIHGDGLLNTVGGPALFRADASGLTQIAINASDAPGGMVVLNNTVFMTVGSHVQGHGPELWEVGPTDSAATFIEALPPTILGGLTPAGGMLFWVDQVSSSSGFQWEVWATHGTQASTQLLGTFKVDNLQGIPGGFTAVGGQVVFQAIDPATGHNALWTTEGTAQTTHVIPNPPFSNPPFPRFYPAGNTLFFLAEDLSTSSEGLFRTDGTTVTRITLPDGVFFDSSSFVTANGSFYFLAGRGAGLYRVDPTATAATLVQQAPALPPGQPGLKGFTNLTNVNGKLFFFGPDTRTGGANTLDVWSSDGTSSGTNEALGPDPTLDYQLPFVMGASGGKFYFGLTAKQSTGTELYVSDGTLAGTHLVKDIRPGPLSSITTSDSGFDVNGTFCFFANDGVHDVELWQTDGTDAGTRLTGDINQLTVGSNPSHLFEYNGLLYFLADDGVHGYELWKTDGTPGGTALVKDINTSLDSNGSPGNLTGNAIANWNTPVVMGGKFYFAANDTIHGTELWVSDGTDAGTHLVKDTNPNSTGAGPTDGGGLLSHDFNSGYNYSPVVASGNQVFFTSDGGGVGIELWVSDGTEAGTHLVKDINQTTDSVGNPGSAFSYQGTREIFPMNGKVYFPADDGIHGVQLWVSDGTETGTQMITNLPGGNPGGLTSAGGKLYFNAFVPDSHGNHPVQLFVSDGTAGNASPVALPAGTEAGTRAEFQGQLYFILDNVPTGGGPLLSPQLWKTDGTPAGTTFIQKIGGVPLTLPNSRGFSTIPTRRCPPT